MASKEREYDDYRIIINKIESQTLIIVPHGGGIEPGTSELGTAVAAGRHTLYCFEGLKARGNAALHITSDNFDEPRCLHLLPAARNVLTVHGCDDEEPIVYVGGLHTAGIEFMVASFRNSGINSVEDTTGHSGKQPNNICNKGLSKNGLQLEISAGLRRQLFMGLKRHERPYTRPLFAQFVEATQVAMDQVTALPLPS